MKFILVWILLIYCTNTYAQKSLNFEAVKKHRTYKFQINKTLIVLYKKNGTSQEIKGRLNILDSKGIYILPLDKQKDSEFIPLDLIISVTKSFEKNVKPIGVFGNMPISIQKGWQFIIK